MTQRNYSNTAVDTTLVGALGSGALSFVVASASGWPSVPFAAVLDPGAVSAEEIVLVTAATGTTWTATRGYGGTTASAHAAGATVRHAAIAADFTDLQTKTPQFYPESYDTIGVSAARDTAAIQAAIDAASTAGGGRVVLTGTYALAYTGTIAHLGKYPTVDYALHINHDNVWIDGQGKATLTLSGVPSGATSNCFAMLLFGNGGSTDGSTVGANGTWIYNTGCIGVTFDCSAMSTSDKTTLSTHIGSGTLVFSYCWDWWVERCRFKSPYGYDGSITGNSASRHGHIHDNEIYSPNKSGVWVDGGVDVDIAHNYLESCGESGIVLGSNLDNGIPALSCVISGNIINDYLVSGVSGVGISASGTDHVIAHNRIQAGNTANKGIYLTSYSTSAGKTDCLRCQVVGNRIYRSGSGLTTYAVDISGVDACVFDGTPLESADHHFVGNYISSNWTRGINFGAQGSRNVFTGNHFACSNIAADTSTSANNIWGVNTYTDALGSAKDIGIANTTLYVRPQTHVQLKGQTNYDLRWGDTQMIRAGAGSPEGVVTASRGSVFLRSDGGASTTIYIKESGTGNTGWVAK